MATQSNPSLDKSHHCEHSADEYQVCLSWSSSFHTEGTGSISGLLSACTFYHEYHHHHKYHDYWYHYYRDRISLIWCCLALTGILLVLHGTVLSCRVLRAETSFFCRVHVVLRTARKYGSLFWTKIGHLDSQCIWYRTVLFWSAYLGFPSKMDRGSIIMDRVFWIEYFGSIILDRLLWIVYFGSIIMDRVFWIGRIVARRGRVIAEPIARWALKIDSAIAVQRFELNTRAYEHDTYTFALPQTRANQKEGVWQQSERGWVCFIYTFGISNIRRHG